MNDRRERPWRKLRVVVEVTVPPTSRAKEGDLVAFVTDALPSHYSAEGRDAAVRTKTFTTFWPMFLRKEKGMKPRPRRDTSLDL